MSYLEQKGFTVERQIVLSTYPEERYNILAYLGAERDTKVCLSSHIDVVCIASAQSETETLSFPHNVIDAVVNSIFNGIRCHHTGLTSLSTTTQKSGAGAWWMPRRALLGRLLPPKSC